MSGQDIVIKVREPFPLTFGDSPRSGIVFGQLVGSLLGYDLSFSLSVPRHTTIDHAPSPTGMKSGSASTERTIIITAS